MTARMIVRLSATASQVRIAATQGPRTLLQANLDPLKDATMPTVCQLLEALSRWQGAPLYVVLLVGPKGEPCARSLYDAIDEQLGACLAGLAVALGPEPARRRNGWFEAARHIEVVEVAR